jgi:glycosyltransferase involved in cell wall biosynthesis
LFSWAGEQVILVGEKTPEEIISLMAVANILTWPGCREAYGMVYLEAACFGVPAVALDNMGVPLVVEHQRTGLLADPNEENGYAKALEQIIINPKLRKSLGDGARDFALNERSASYTAKRLKSIVDDVLKD